MALSLAELIRDTAGLARRFGPIHYLEFLAVSVGVTTLNALIAPGDLVARTEDAGGRSLFEVFSDPMVILHEASFTAVFGLAVLRIWWLTEAPAPPPEARRRLVAQNIVPLLVLNIAAAYLSYLAMLFMVLPALVVAAVTTTLVPAVLLEGRGWQGLGRALSMVRGSVWKLTAAWALVLVPWLLIAIATAPRPGGFDVEDTAALWRAWLFSDLFSSLFAVISLCLVVAAYRQIVENEGGSSAALEETFR